jgi:uncharacterized protein (DUF1501 family)
MTTPVTRRTFLAGAGALLSAAALPRYAFAAPGALPGRDALVVIFLSGGMDGLNVVVPYGDADYLRLRPDLGLFPPDAGADATLPLDGFFGLHPDFAAVEPLFLEGKLAFVHATGLATSSRSHFESRERIARGDAASGNWLDRHLSSVGSTGLLQSAALGAQPVSLRGSPYALGLGEGKRTGLASSSGRGGEYASAWSSLYGAAGELGYAARTSLEAASRLAATAPALDPEDGAVYPDTPFGRQLRRVAELIKADIGLEVASLELSGWDHHDREAPRLSALLQEFGGALAAFDADLGRAWPGSTWSR